MIDRFSQRSQKPAAENATRRTVFGTERFLQKSQKPATYQPEICLLEYLGAYLEGSTTSFTYCCGSRTPPRRGNCARTLRDVRKRYEVTVFGTERFSQRSQKPAAENTTRRMVFGTEWFLQRSQKPATYQPRDLAPIPTFVCCSQPRSLEPP